MSYTEKFYRKLRKSEKSEKEEKSKALIEPEQVSAFVEEKPKRRRRKKTTEIVDEKD